MKNKIRIVFAVLLFSSLSYADNGGVASDSTLLGLPPVGGAPGNSWAAQGGFMEFGDPNCIGDRFSLHAQSAPGAVTAFTVDEGPGAITTRISIAATLGSFVGASPAGDCSNVPTDL